MSKCVFKPAKEVGVRGGGEGGKSKFVTEPGLVLRPGWEKLHLFRSVIENQTRDIPVFSYSVLFLFINLFLHSPAFLLLYAHLLTCLLIYSQLETFKWLEQV